jgi:predicted phosphodiesterase
MKVAIISDIHGNAVAFEAVLAALHGEAPDRVLCLGDAIQGGPEPRRVVELLRELGCPVVMGNADAFLLGTDTGAEHMDDARRRSLEAVRDWTVAQLSEPDRAFIAAFAPTVAMPLEGGRELLGFHGSPASFDDLLLPLTPDDALDRLLGGVRADITCGGHTHVQFVRRRGAGLFFNPGSVGLAYDHRQEGVPRPDPWAEYALLTSRGRDLGLEFRRVPFDLPALLQRYRASGRPDAEVAIRQYGG